MAHIRWSIRRDCPDIVAIEATREGGWDEARYLESMRARNVIGMVVEVKTGKQRSDEWGGRPY